MPTINRLEKGEVGKGEVGKTKNPFALEGEGVRRFDGLSVD